ncbi:hypothetical protein FKM82_028738 [Ascaphus truei]
MIQSEAFQTEPGRVNDCVTSILRTCQDRVVYRTCTEWTPEGSGYRKSCTGEAIFLAELEKLLMLSTMYLSKSMFLIDVCCVVHRFILSL